MTIDLVAELRSRDVYRTGHFQLSSGLHSDTYLQCALALQDPPFALRLGRLVAAAVAAEAFDVVVSPALGGVLIGFAVACAAEVRFVFTERHEGGMTLRRGQWLDPGERALVVEDVLTTGGSAREAGEVVAASGAVVVGYAAVVDRSTAARPLPFDATALVRVEPRTWAPEDCPLCAAGAAVDSPGSRHR